VARPDVLLVSLGTTLGWRVADRMLLAQIQRAGATTEAVAVGRGATDRLRRGYPVNDLVEMYAARRAARTAVERHEPRALVVSSTTASMLLPSLPVPYAVRFDAPARLNRPGARNALLRRLERRAMRRARLTIPFSVAGGEALPDGAARPVVVSPPIDPSWIDAPGEGGRGAEGNDPPTERERLAVAYVSDPKAKGLDVLVGGWSAAAVEGARLEVYGLDPEWARSHLRRTGIPEPDSLDLPGTVGAAEFRAALRRARVFIHGARWEDWGQAPLEALADGALLATVPSGGPYEGLRLARRLDSSLVADRIDGATLAPAIRAAFDLPDERVRAYRARAAELLRPYRSDAVQETVARELLPALLG
jgi:glycosyltransferase involved in cell wall biosynthesis